MNCLKAEHISAYLDNALETKERASVETHLKGCARCAGALAEMQSLQRAFSAAGRFKAPYGFSTRVLARTAELESPSSYPLPMGERIKKLIFPLPSGERMKVRGWFLPVFTRFAEAAVLVLVIFIGIGAGTFITKGFTSPRTANLASSMSLDIFDAAPPGSLGGAYLAMTEANHEK